MDTDASFRSAYDAVLRRWPSDVRGLDVPSPYGTTRVQICGPEDGTPLVLLPGGGTTSVVWFANVAALAATHRVHAVDLMGDVGRSVHDGRPLRGAGDLTTWLDAVHDALGLDSVLLCGHSYGAWIALNYALRSPDRVARLALLDPTNCFAGMSPRYLLHAVPLLLRRTPKRARAFLRWETGGAPEDPVWRDFLDSASTAPRSKVVAMRRPRERELRACTIPTLVALAERSRAHDVRQVSAGVHRLMPHAVVSTLPNATHHNIPTEQPALLNEVLTSFLS